MFSQTLLHYFFGNVTLQEIFMYVRIAVNTKQRKFTTGKEHLLLEKGKFKRKISHFGLARNENFFTNFSEFFP